MPCNAPSPVINEVAAPRNEAGASFTSLRPYSDHKSASGVVGGLSPKSIISFGIAASWNVEQPARLRRWIHKPIRSTLDHYVSLAEATQPRQVALHGGSSTANPANWR